MGRDRGRPADRLGTDAAAWRVTTSRDRQAWREGKQPRKGLPYETSEAPETGE